MLRFTELSLRRGPRLLFEQVSLQIHPGYRVGLTGANGTGKSSLFSLILGELHVDTGEIFVPRNWVIAHVAQEAPAGNRAAIEYVLDGDRELRELERQLVIAEAADDGERIAELHASFESVGGYQARSRAARLMHGLGFSVNDDNRAASEFSGGWRMRLNLAQALMCRSDLLLLDEPTNHLDLDAVIWLENWLRGYPGTLMLISHDRDFLDSVTDHIAHIEQQHIVLYAGNYSAFEVYRAEKLAGQQAQYAKQQREIAHMHSYVERFRAKATKARQAQSRLKALERMEKIAPAHVDSPFHFTLPAAEKMPDPLLRLDGVAAGYGNTTIISGVNLGLSPGDRIGLLGPNGAGKSTLIKLLAGELAALTGDYLPAQDLNIGYFAQHQIEQLDPQHSPLDHLQQLDPLAREQVLRDYLGGFGFVGDQALALTGPFSGGEKSRLALALLVYRRPNLLLLDEPTNHLDLEMRQALATALQDFEGAMVLVSHDRHLLRVCCDRLLRVHDGTVDEFPLGLDDYPGWLAEQTRQVSPASDPEDSSSRNAGTRKEQKRREAEQRKQLQPLRKKVDRAESRLDILHAHQQTLEQQLASPELYTDENRDQLKTLLREKAEVDRACEAAEADWLEAAELLESATTDAE
ncbi:ATP-binding cassette subfamily F protein 3 [Thiogranum longum]|uniref:Probable ATP-binding protein YheS n=1 Tax=Thiogranum longum TaxID=1537524 RepID=A0A4R1HEX5_9GAMM|nr:ATP-binding cassette domain-containing protein [Thiogranum longum]TCK18750.1 ATP-binding cassette subfamily F protein 3 [Thiogranum longum]